MIETERLILRPPAESDKHAVRVQLSNYEIACWLAKVPHPYPPGHEETWWARVLERERLGYPPYFMMGPKEQGETAPIGAIAIGPGPSGSWRMGYWLDQPWWGKRFMSEAAACVLDHAFAAWRPDHVLAGVYEGNAASERILRGLGFTYVDTTEEWCEARQTSLPHINLVKEHPKPEDAGLA